MCELTAPLLAKRNRDGGFPYRSGSSWTEPTAFALLALSSAGYAGREVDEAHRWIRQTQNGDGGWSAAPGIGQSCSATNAALLSLLDQDIANDSGRRSLAWVLSQTSADSGMLARFVRFLESDSSQDREGGAPWFPGTSAWVYPSCMMLLLLCRATKLTGRKDYESRMIEAQKYLLARRLPDGGWNHGGWYAPGEHVASYPETTGLALLALKSYAGPELNSSIRLAQQMLPAAQSAEAWAWLRLGLVAHGAKVEDQSPNPLRCWTTVELALSLLAQTAHLDSNRLTGGAHA
ncbi:MAG: prenyltransferase/squalene oxidase repeat-containing protein [Bryobacteraceae bacterium]